MKTAADTRHEARAWVHGAIRAECHWSASAGWAHSKWCDELTETRTVALERDEAKARLASAMLLLRRVRSAEDLPMDMEREFQLHDDIEAFLGPEPSLPTTCPTGEGHEDNGTGECTNCGALR